MATKAEPPGSESVDRLADVLKGLELSSQAKSANGPQDEPKPGTHARRGAESRRSEDKENDRSAELTPSRLTCFTQLREELTCAVCLDICVRPCTTPCGHNYCRSCLRRNMEINQPKCPKCRADLPASFTLNINTSLWCTIQHLFPAEASGKPLTPPPPPAQQQQPAGGGQILSRGAVDQGTAAHGTHIAAPFRPPRFVAAAGPTGPSFTGHISSRANAAAAVELSTMGTASFYGRSTSGPRPQRASSGPSNSAAAAIGAASGQTSGPRSVFSLAELGVRPAREGVAARRDRRRSRSAERWEGSERSMFLPSADEDTAPGLAAGPATGVARTNAQYNALPASSSRLMELLSGAPRNAAAPATHGSFLKASRAPAAQRSESNRTAADNVAAGFSDAPRGVPPGASSGHSLNPFLRLPRPAAARPPAAAAGPAAAPTRAATARDPQGSTAAGSWDTGMLNVGAGVQQRPAVGPSGAAHFTASQRALLNASVHSQGPPSARVASSSRPTAPGSAFSRSSDEDAGPVSDGAAAPAPRTASATSQGSGSCSSSGSGSSRVGDDRSSTTLGSFGSSWSAQALDNVSELELNDPEGGRLQRHRGGGSSNSAASDGLVTPWGSSGGPGRSALEGRDFRVDVVDLGATRGLSATHVAASSRSGEPVALLRRPLSLRVDAGSDDGSLELLDEPTPPRQHRAASDANAGTAVTAAGPVSPTWSHLDDQLARAMEPLRISPPSLPRLRLPSRQSAPAVVDSTQPCGADTGGPTTSWANNTHFHPHHCPGAGEASWSGSSPQHMDPDLASNYDGEDPAGADTFFSSPFFDRKLLRETLEDGAVDPDGAGSEAGFSPRRAGAAAAGIGGSGEVDEADREQGNGGPLAARLARSADVGGWESAGRDDMAAARRTQAEDARLPPGHGVGGASRPARGVSPARCEPSSSARLAGQQLRVTQPQEALAVRTGAAARAGRGQQAGDRGCPIELLSDSDEEEAGMGFASLDAAGSTAEPADRRSSQRVVSGLRRPLRR